MCVWKGKQRRKVFSCFFLFLVTKIDDEKQKRNQPPKQEYNPLMCAKNENDCPLHKSRK